MSQSKIWARAPTTVEDGHWLNWGEFMMIRWWDDDALEQGNLQALFSAPLLGRYFTIYIMYRNSNYAFESVRRTRRSGDDDAMQRESFLTMFLVKWCNATCVYVFDILATKPNHHPPTNQPTLIHSFHYYTLCSSSTSRSSFFTGSEGGSWRELVWVLVQELTTILFKTDSILS